MIPHDSPLPQRVLCFIQQLQFLSHGCYCDSFHIDYSVDKCFVVSWWDWTKTKINKGSISLSMKTFCYCLENGIWNVLLIVCSTKSLNLNSVTAGVPPSCQQNQTNLVCFLAVPFDKGHNTNQPEDHQFSKSDPSLHIFCNQAWNTNHSPVCKKIMIFGRWLRMTDIWKQINWLEVIPDQEGLLSEEIFFPFAIWCHLDWNLLFVGSGVALICGIAVATLLINDLALFHIFSCHIWLLFGLFIGFEQLKFAFVFHSKTCCI